jgi:heat shock protein HslJ
MKLFLTILFVIAVFTPVATLTRKAPLVGSWNLTKVNGAAPSQPVNVTFEADRINFKYCNFINMPYKLNGSRITIDNAVSTRMACLNEMKPSESDLTKAFTGAKKWKVSKRLLTIYGPNNAVLARLEKTG